MSGYLDSAHAWNRAGWGALPLPDGKKFPPPQGWTGRGAPYPSGADVQAWGDEDPEANLALRFPNGVVGLDVDAYGDKPGRRTLVDHSKKWGAPPRTVRITSRTDGISGIYLYRLPEGASSDRFMGELPGGGVEILRPEHRYAVGPGSTHPDGGTYHLLDQRHVEMEGPVSRMELAELPAAWVEGLTLNEKPVVDADVELANGRGDRYAQRAVELVVAELRDIAGWPVGKRDGKGRGWEKIQADAAYRLASLALAPWNSLTIEQAMNAFGAAAPIGEGWSNLDVASKWRSQVRRAEPAAPPPDSDDPLSPGYIAPDFDNAAGLESALADDGDPTPPAAVPELLTTIAANWVKHSWDDHGNAERVISMFGNELKYLPAVDRWMRYNSSAGRWEESKHGGKRAVAEMVERVPKLEQHLYSGVEFQKTANKTTTMRAEFAEWVATQRFDSRHTSGANVLKTLGALDDDPASFDADPLIINCRNGIIDLQTGELLKHDPAHRSRHQVQLDYNPDAKAPRFMAFIERAHPNEEMRGYLQRSMGYTLTGQTVEQVFFMHHGPPATGKSLFLDLMTSMMKEFHAVIESLSIKKQETHPAGLMKLKGRRLLTLSETAEGARLDESLVKRLSGEDSITARGMGGNFQDFKLVGKVHLVTNHLPHISDDEAIRRRIHLIGWNEIIPPEERDFGLRDAILREEMEGVFAWAVAGALGWQSERLNRPLEAEAATSAYFDEEDEFAEFIRETLQETEVATTETKALYRYYAQWCDSSRTKPMSKIAFAKKLVKKGFRSYRTNTARGFYCTLKTDPIEADPLR